MGRLLATAGTKIFIGPTKEFGSGDFTAADFSSITGSAWTRILGTTNLGGSGDTATLIASDQIDTGDETQAARTRKLKGSRNAGSMELVCDLDMTDPGQIALVAAQRSVDTYAFKIEFNDKPKAGASPKPSTRYFVALVMSASETYDEANSIMKLNATLEIDSNIVRVQASAS